MSINLMMKKRLTKISVITNKKIYGGSLNYRKIARPLPHSKAIHLTLRSTIQSGNGISLRKEVKDINKYLMKFSSQNKITIYNHSINSNHIHIVLRVKDRIYYRKFIRAFSAAVSLIFKTKYSYINKFWMERPFSRIVNWGKDFKNLCQYIQRNFKETVGFIIYRKRGPYYDFLSNLSNTT